MRVIHLYKDYAPVVGGIENHLRLLAEGLVARRPGLRVLYMSGYTDGQLHQHGVLKRGVALLAKPFTPDQLVRRVRAALDVVATR